MGEKPRYYALDALRGLSIILMIFYHFGFNLVQWDILPAWVLYNPLLNFLEVFFASVFVAISGASCTFSHNNLRRSIQILACALLVSAATYAFDPALAIRFGILHFLGFAALIYALAGPWIARLRVPPAFWLVLFVLGYVFLESRTFPVEHLWALGIRSPSFSSADYFPIFPWIFMYFFGVWLGGMVAQGKLPAWFYRVRAPLFESAGRHTLLIYVLHQPVLVGLTYFILFVLGRLAL